MTTKKICVLFVALATGSPVIDLPIYRFDSGPHEVRAILNPGPSAEEMWLKLQFAEDSILDYELRGSEVVMPGQAEGQIMPLDATRTQYWPEGYLNSLGIGSTSYLVELYNSIDVYRSGSVDSSSFLRFGQYLEEFHNSACINGTMFAVPVGTDGTPNTLEGRFQVIDPVSNETIANASALKKIEIKEIMGSGPFAWMPRSVASPIDALLIANGAVRTETHMGHDASIWDYENCSAETLANLPILEIQLFGTGSNGGPIRRGSVKVNPAVYMPECELRVVEDGADRMPAIDIARIPDVNIRITRERLYFCDAISS